MDATLDNAEAHLRSIISSLYIVISQAHEYHGLGTQKSITNEIKNLIHQLVQLSQTARHLPINLPFDLIQYVEESRNPDIYGRQFVELVLKLNQQAKGRAEAFASFRDILGREMASGIPDIKNDVQQVVAATGGKLA
ncbi:hypothetical protein LTR36_007981 [Oleoguttula mirabilis]|uniref:Mediator of RNA polymerase II transcription subunit 10 n=1 Tax=Oleoguttula mirabilis TaxID=1507867 RepID=A0AAV9JAF1_9PEZI|nr:hypothetical protein LTR36_007981 [Oleoguttula mirabilis]